MTTKIVVEVKRRSLHLPTNKADASLTNKVTVEVTRNPRFQSAQTSEPTALELLKRGLGDPQATFRAGKWEAIIDSHPSHPSLFGNDL